MNIVEISIGLPTAGTSEKVTLAAGSVQMASAAAAVTSEKGQPIKYLVTPDTSVFVAKGTNPTAVNTGADLILIANNSYRVELMDGEKLAFIPVTGTTGNVYVTPRA